MLHEVLHGLLLEVHNDAPPADEDWDEFLAVCATLDIAALQGALVLCEGPGPNAAQRRALATLLKGRHFPTVVLTSSIVTRGAVTALSWLGHSIRAMPPQDVLRALDRYQLTPAQRRDVLLRMVQLKHALDGTASPATLASLDIAALARMIASS